MPTDIEYLSRPNGRIAYDVTGSGPLVVCVPGMGELRSSFRALVPALVGRAYRVATVDLRGHGESDTGFDSFDDTAAASDVIALIEHPVPIPRRWRAAPWAPRREHWRLPTGRT